MALTPAATATLVKKGFTVNVEDGAGLESKFRNEDYASAGARVVDKNTAFHSGHKIFLDFVLINFSGTSSIFMIEKWRLICIT